MSCGCGRCVPRVDSPWRLQSRSWRGDLPQRLAGPPDRRTRHPRGSMSTSLQITSATPDPDLLDLPWHIPLEEWPAEHLAALPRGISRHVVRFARMSGRVVAIKEISTDIA